jgi:hypothetical protein
MIVAIHMCLIRENKYLSLIQHIIPSLVFFVHSMRLVATCPLGLIWLSGGALHIFAPQAHLQFFSISSTLRVQSSHSRDPNPYLLFFPSSRSSLLSTTHGVRQAQNLLTEHIILGCACRAKRHNLLSTTTTGPFFLTLLLSLDRQVQNCAAPRFLSGAQVQTNIAWAWQRKDGSMSRGKRVEARARKKLQ